MSSQLDKLIGKTPIETIGNIGDDQFLILFKCGSSLKLYHEHDCCEHFWLEDIVGDVSDLIGNPLTMCEEVENKKGFIGEFSDFQLRVIHNKDIDTIELRLSIFNGNTSRTLEEMQAIEDWLLGEK